MSAFPLWPVYPMTRRLRVDVLQRRRMDLKVERIFKNRHVQHIFEIRWQTLTPEQRLVLDDFFRSVRGRSLGNIDFQDPFDNVHYTCRFDADAQSFEEPVAKRWSGTIRLIEVTGFKTLKAPVPVFPAFTSGFITQLPYRMTRFYRTVIEQQQDDSEKRFEDFAIESGIERWSVGGEQLDDTNAANLMNTWEGNAGPYRSMSFTEPERGLVYNAHFLETECVHELVAPCQNSCRLTLEELK